MIVTWSQKMMIFLPDDDFVTENSGEAVLDESVRFYEKGLQSVFLLNYPPFSTWPLFVCVVVTMTKAHLIPQKP